MGGGKSDYIQIQSYPNEVNKYVDLIKSMNSRNADDANALSSYISNGGWNARKNGRDLNIVQNHYHESIENGKYIITITNPSTDWREWIKTLGDLPFEFTCRDTQDGYQISCDSSISKKYPKVFKMFKQVFRKSSQCVSCRVCETNCKNGCISFTNGGLSISNCIHCGQCQEIDDGCLVYHSLRISTGEGKMKKESINSFANHAPKPDWVQEFFDLKEEYWNENTLNKKLQEPKLKRFLREGGLIDSNGKTTFLFDIVLS